MTTTDDDDDDRKLTTLVLWMGADPAETEATGDNDRRQRPETTTGDTRPETHDRRQRPETTTGDNDQETTTGDNDRRQRPELQRPGMTTAPETTTRGHDDCIVGLNLNMPITIWTRRQRPFFIDRRSFDRSSFDRIIITDTVIIIIDRTTIRPLRFPRSRRQRYGRQLEPRKTTTVWRI